LGSLKSRVVADSPARRNHGENAREAVAQAVIRERFDPLSGKQRTLDTAVNDGTIFQKISRGKH
jgi:hypothetical protein